MSEYILRIEDLHFKYFEEREVLSSVSLNVKASEKIAVLGSNGSGKSTFFLNINGVYHSDKGRIYYKDKLIGKADLAELRKYIGIVFQDADSQIIASTVRAEVSFGPLNLKLPKDEVIRRVENSLNYMNISNLVDRAPHHLSGGEKKRVSIADIIAMEPEIIIFDEPTASLDPLNVSVFEELLKKLHDEAKTLIISTHDIDFAFKWADRIVVFAEGRIIADAPPLDVFADSSVLETASLKKPVLLQIYETLRANSVLGEGTAVPRSLDEFKELF